MTPDDLDQALCAQVGVDLHFPDAGMSPKRAKAICHACPITTRCLAWALLQDQSPAGVWGAKTWLERRAMRRDAIA